MGRAPGTSSSGMRVAICGTGAFGQGLAALAARSGSSARVCLASRRLAPDERLVLPGLEAVPVVPMTEALESATLVVLAIPASALPGFVAAHGRQLRPGSVVLDVSNPTPADLARLGASDCCAAAAREDVVELVCDIDAAKDVDVVFDDTVDGTAVASAAPSSAAAWLAAALPPDVSVVKGLCNLSAYTLLHGDPLTEHMKTEAASDSADASSLAAEFCRSIGLEVREVHTLSHAAALERYQRKLLPSWQWPTCVMLALWLVVHVYSFIRYNHYGRSPWQGVTMWILNKSVGWAGMWGMVLTYLPGVLVCWTQLLLRRPAMRLPAWLKAWMDARKQLGLLSLAAVLLHLLLSAFLFTPAYYPKLFEASDTQVFTIVPGNLTLDKFGLPPPAQGGPGAAAHSAQGVRVPLAGYAAGAAANGSQLQLMLVGGANVISLRSRLTWIGESSTLLGILSGCLMGLIALQSLPCITPKLNWLEWRLLQSQAGWLAVATATAHVLLLGAPWWHRAVEDWPAMIPTITLVSAAPACVLLLLKGGIALPPLSWALRRVRSGAWAKGKGASTSDVVWLSKTMPAFAVPRH